MRGVMTVGGMCACGSGTGVVNGQCEGCAVAAWPYADGCPGSGHVCGATGAGPDGWSVVTVPAGGIGEEARLTVWDRDRARVMALVRHLSYGPDYLRTVAEDLDRMSRCVGWGEVESSAYWLDSAEHCAGHGITGE